MSTGIVPEVAGAGSATSANQVLEIAALNAIDAGTPAALGQTTMAASMPVVIASNQSAIPISGTVTVDTSLLATQATLAALLAKVIAAPSTEAKQDSLNTLITTLNSIVATAAKQDTGNTSLSSIDGKFTTLNAKDFATQTTLAAVLAKIIAAPATEAKQDTGNTSLSSIDGKLTTLNAKDFATQTTLAAVLAKIIAAPATEAKQDTEITNLVAIKTAVEIIDNAISGNEMQVGASVAHDAVDSGNPIKIGGKVSTSIPTPVANADRTDAQFDEFGRQVFSDKDTELGLTIGTTGLRDRLFAQRHTVLSDSLADGIALFWTQTTANGGTIIRTDGEGQLKTSTSTTGLAQIVSPLIPYYPGQVAWLNSAIRFGDTGVAGDIRRLGMFTVDSSGTPQEGFYYELNGTSLTAVTCKAGVATAVAQASWTKNSVFPFTLDANYVSFEIRYTANSVWFYINNVLRHNVAGTTASLTSSLSLPICVQNIKTSGATDITFGVRNIGNGGFGQRGGVVNETGLSAVEAQAMGGGTPHDSVDTGNPLKMGGYASTLYPTAVQNGDRVNSWFTPNGAQMISDINSDSMRRLSELNQLEQYKSNMMSISGNYGFELR